MAMKRVGWLAAIALGWSAVGGPALAGPGPCDPRERRLFCGDLPVSASACAELEASDEAFGKVNQLMLRNCSIGNFLDRCSATVPVHESGSAPVGLMLVGETMADDALLSVSAAVEAVFR